MKLSDNEIITAGLTVGTGTYMARCIVIDLITAVFDIIDTFRTQRNKKAKPPS